MPMSRQQPRLALKLTRLLKSRFWFRRRRAGDLTAAVRDRQCQSGGTSFTRVDELGRSLVTAGSGGFDLQPQFRTAKSKSWPSAWPTRSPTRHSGTLRLQNESLSDIRWRDAARFGI